MGDLATTHREAMAKECDTLHNRLFVFQILLVGILLAVFQFGGSSVTLANGLSARFGESLWYVTNAVYAAIGVFGFSACLFLLSYYSGHVLNRYYELSDETFGEWMSDFVKSLLIDIVLATILFSVIYALLRWMPNWWWLCAAVFNILFGVIFSMFLPVLILPLFHKFKPLEEGGLTQAVRSMMEAADIKVVGVFKWGMETRGAAGNVAFVGMGRAKRIVLDDALLSGYTQDEILAMLAHETGHYKNRDMLRITLVNSLLALAGFYVAHRCLSAGVWFLGITNVYDIGAAPIFVFSLFIFSLVAMPFSNMHSRRCEFAADTYAIKTMRSPEALISAFEKVADQNLFNKEPAAWIEFLLHSHPSIARRIARIREG